MMSVTGPPEGDPSKVGVALADVIAGLNATIGASSHRGKGRSRGRARKWKATC